MIAVFELLAALAVLSMATGCGASLASQRAEGMHEALNVVSDVADPLYSAATVACDAAEGVVIARQGTTEAQDRLDVARIREACDRAYAGFEALRHGQLAARQAAEVVRGGEDAEAMRHALDAIQELHSAAQAARGTWDEARSVLRDVTGPPPDGGPGG